jgi:plastocyanin
VPVGQALMFRNNSAGTHHIVADNGAWDAGTLPPGGASPALNVNSQGTFSYHCTIHASMVGAIN